MLCYREHHSHRRLTLAVIHSQGKSVQSSKLWVTRVCSCMTMSLCSEWKIRWRLQVCHYHVSVCVLLFFRTAGDDVSNGKCCVSLKVFTHTHTHTVNPSRPLCVCVSAAAGVYAARHTHLSARKDCKSHTCCFTVKNTVMYRSTV